MVKQSNKNKTRVLSNEPLQGEDKACALDLVSEIQKDRGPKDLAPKDVPDVLLRYQAAWQEDLSPIRAAEKSRRIGFSWGCLASESVLEASIRKSDGGMDQLYMGYNQAMAAEFIGDCAFFAKAFGQAFKEIEVWKEVALVEDERRDILRYKIMMASGFKIEALSSNPFNWRGKQGHARIDEAAFHDNLREVIKGALAYRMWGGRIDVISTHNGEDNEFAELIRDIRAGTLPWSLHSVSFNDALRDGFYNRVCLVRGIEFSKEGEEIYEQEVRGDYPDKEDAAEELDLVAKRGSGAYFSRLIIEPCQRDDIPILKFSQATEFVLDPERILKTQQWIDENLAPIIAEMPTDRKTAMGQDFGRSGDLSVIWPFQEKTDGVWRTPFLLEMRNIPFDCQWIITKCILQELPLLQNAKFDSRGNGQSHAENALQLLGHSFVECVMLSQGWYGEWFPKYHKAYESKELEVPPGEDIITDHKGVILRAGKPAISAAKVKGSDGKYRHADSAVAGVLGYAATKGDGMPPAAGATVGRTAQDKQSKFLQDKADRLIGRPRGTDYSFRQGKRKWH